MKHMIWSNDVDDIKAIAGELRSDNPDLTEDDAWSDAIDLNGDYLSDELANLKVEVGDILVIADLGLWNGRTKAHKTIRKYLSNAYDVTCGDCITWYVEDGEMKIDDTHHDGTNHYLFRAWKDGVDRDELIGLISAGHEDVDTLNKYTRPLGEDVRKVYGWTD